MSLYSAAQCSLHLNVYNHYYTPSITNTDIIPIFPNIYEQNLLPNQILKFQNMNKWISQFCRIYNRRSCYHLFEAGKTDHFHI